MKEQIDLIKYLPDKIRSDKGDKYFDLIFREDGDQIMLNYIVNYITNNGGSSPRSYSLLIPRFIPKTRETFQVLGLMQAEMGKTYTGELNFTNCELRLVRFVINWFEKFFGISRKLWSWNITINLREPQNDKLREELRDSLSELWCMQLDLNFDKRYPKTLLFWKPAKKDIPDDEGTLRIAIKNNLLSQVFKTLLNKLLLELDNFNEECIRGFMQGLIAGDGCVSCDPKSRHYTVHITASKESERLIYQKCLAKLGINLKLYNHYKETLISERKNLIQLLKQRLITLDPRKYNKFLYMMQKYKDVKEESGYFSGKKHVWNKIPKVKIDNILELYKSGLINTQELAEKVGVSRIKVQRVLKENHLGIRRVKISEDLRNKIAEFAVQNPGLRQLDIAGQFKVHESVVGRAIKKYKIINQNL